jgi:predicted TIM-barrel fold metal-dependent hydrolase
VARAIPVALRDVEELAPWLPDRWVTHVGAFGARQDPLGPSETRFDADGEAVLLPVTPAGRQTNLELDAALASAVNDWQVATWLERDRKLRASIAIAPEWPEAAAEEIGRRASDRRFVQVLLAGRTRSPIGDPRYWPIYEAAERSSLPVAIWPAGGAWFPTTGAGWPSYPLEESLGTALALQAGIASLVFNGAFERFAGLRVVSVGAGHDWVAPLAWRLDGCWKMLKDEVPDLRRLPSEYVRDCCYFTGDQLVSGADLI